MSVKVSDGLSSPTSLVIFEDSPLNKIPAEVWEHIFDVISNLGERLHAVVSFGLSCKGAYGTISCIRVRTSSNIIPFNSLKRPLFTHLVRSKEGKQVVPKLIAVEKQFLPVRNILCARLPFLGKDPNKQLLLFKQKQFLYGFNLITNQLQTLVDTHVLRRVSSGRDAMRACYIAWQEKGKPVLGKGVDFDPPEEEIDNVLILKDGSYAVATCKYLFFYDPANPDKDVKFYEIPIRHVGRYETRSIGAMLEHNGALEIALKEFGVDYRYVRFSLKEKQFVDSLIPKLPVELLKEGPQFIEGTDLFYFPDEWYLANKGKEVGLPGLLWREEFGEFAAIQAQIRETKAKNDADEEELLKTLKERRDNIEKELKNTLRIYRLDEKGGKSLFAKAPRQTMINPKFIHNERWVVAAIDEKHVYVWDAETGKEMYAVLNALGRFREFDFYLRGDLLVSVAFVGLPLDKQSYCGIAVVDLVTGKSLITGGHALNPLPLDYSVGEQVVSVEIGNDENNNKNNEKNKEESLYIISKKRDVQDPTRKTVLTRYKLTFEKSPEEKEEENPSVGSSVDSSTTPLLPRRVTKKRHARSSSLAGKSASAPEKKQRKKLERSYSTSAISGREPPNKIPSLKNITLITPGVTASEKVVTTPERRNPQNDRTPSFSCSLSMGEVAGIIVGVSGAVFVVISAITFGGLYAGNVGIIISATVGAGGATAGLVMVVAGGVLFAKRRLKR